MKIVICDDDDGCCSQIEKWVLEYEKQKNISIEVDIYNSAETLIKHIQRGYAFDAIYLDIELPKKNGIELGHIIRERLDATVISIIFISGKTQYCVDLFELEPMYLRQNKSSVFSPELKVKLSFFHSVAEVLPEVELNFLLSILCLPRFAEASTSESEVSKET